MRNSQSAQLRKSVLWASVLTVVRYFLICSLIFSSTFSIPSNIYARENSLFRTPKLANGRENKNISPVNAQINISKLMKIEAFGEKDPQIIIHTSEKPLFTILNQKSPPRIVIDFLHLSVIEYKDVVISPSPFIKHVTTSQYNDQNQQIGRVTITLIDTIPYQFDNDENSVSLKLTPSDEQKAQIFQSPSQEKTDELSPSLPQEQEPSDLHDNKKDQSEPATKESVSQKNETIPHVTEIPETVLSSENANSNDTLSEAEKAVEETLPNATMLDEIAVEDAILPMKVVMLFNGKSPKFDTLILKQPFRLVLDIADVTYKNFKWPKIINKQALKQIRFGKHEDKLRLVFDFKKEIGDYTFQAEQNTITLVLGKVSKGKTSESNNAVSIRSNSANSNSTSLEKDKKELTSSLSTKHEPKQTISEPSKENKTLETEKVSEAKNNASDNKKVPHDNQKKESDKSNELPNEIKDKKEKDADILPIEITDIRLEKQNSFHRIIIETNNKAIYELDNLSRIEPVLTLLNAKLPQNFEKAYDTSLLQNSNIIGMTAYNSQNQTTKIRVNLTDPIAHVVSQKNHLLFWDFSASENSAKKEQSVQEVQYLTEKIGGVQISEKKSDDNDNKKSDEKNQMEKKSGSSNKVSINLKNADIHNVLRFLGEISRQNIVVDENVKGTISVRLNDVPWQQALAVVLKTKQLGMQKAGNIIRISPIETLQKEKELEFKKFEAEEKLKDLHVRLIPVNYANASEIQTQLQSIKSERGKVTVDPRTNVIIAEDIEERLINMERLVTNLDAQTPQVLIEARIVEADITFSRELGIQWGVDTTFSQARGNSTGLLFPNSVQLKGASDDANTPKGGVGDGSANVPTNFAVNLPIAVGTGTGGSLGVMMGSVGGNFNLDLRLSAAEANSEIKIVSAPKVVTLDNKQAMIKQGEKVPITIVTANGPTTQFIEANLSLQVTPHVTSEGSILMQIDATKNELSSRTDQAGTPGILTKEAHTQMLVRDGDTAVLGGIYTKRESESSSAVPFISEIPILGWFFKNKRNADDRTELLIFITPRIVNRTKALALERDALE